PSLSCFSAVPPRQAVPPSTGVAPGCGLFVASGHAPHGGGHGGWRSCFSKLLQDRRSRRGLRPVSRFSSFSFSFIFLFSFGLIPVHLLHMQACTIATRGSLLFTYLYFS